MAVTAAAIDEDTVLARDAAAGNEAAFEELYRRHVGFVWSRLTRLVGPVPDREDLLQHIFLDLYRALPRFRGEASLRTFLHHIVANICHEHLTRTRRRPRAVPIDELMTALDPQPSPEERSQRAREIERTWAMLDRLKPAKRIAFLLRVVDGLSLQEVARIVGARRPAVWARVRAAERELAAMMKQDSEGRAR
jgi:RNA polymerase sigma-70 factor (ECF subfamily)